MEKIAFIGTGVMGKSMAGHLLEGGYSLTVYNRTKAKAEDLIRQEAQWADTPGQAASGADIVISIVGYPRDVEEVYLAPGGIVDSAKKGAVLIDMTTSSPALAGKIAEKAREKGLYSLDAPVSGGDTGAKNAALSIMVGGDEDSFNKILPVFQRMGKNIVFQGGPGSGQHCKMSNQIVIASTMMAVAEALCYGLKAGLNPRTMLKSIESGAAGSWTLSNLVPRMLDGNVNPGFYVKHFIKDMGIALDSARELGLKLPGLEKAEQLYQTLAAMDRGALEQAARAAAELDSTKAMTPASFSGEARNGGDLGTQAIYLLYAAGRV
ncbi:NAD(P)-dependent oxidoreductase [Breznakiella homolactica]|uniref:NAD(P)-dependent oxidoreductase n=1 Tax=Breznakiella homolactica TaxID=2798577 RepID=A0A7T7XPU2_9SPIR|nr:NAD(P)-dependent oxidoreductase [Breznakiella homolactica]QQO10285.1 NAD(P)-dependent oxidoreductase [Breznakiella homolactica]